jgi:hypothetical protein
MMWLLPIQVVVNHVAASPDGIVQPVAGFDAGCG